MPAPVQRLRDVRKLRGRSGQTMKEHDGFACFGAVVQKQRATRFRDAGMVPLHETADSCVRHGFKLLHKEVAYRAVLNFERRVFLE